MSQVWDCDYCKCVTRKPGPNCKNLNCSCHPAQNLQQQLEAAKLREAELVSALEWFGEPGNYIRREGSFYNPDGSFRYCGFDSNVGVFGLAKATQALSNPSAALAERDK